MASLYRKTYRRSLPDNAETFTRKGCRFARWTDARGRTRTAKLSPDGAGILVLSPVWYARYRDADGIERRETTGCRDEQAARQVLADLQAESEKVRSGILSAAESQAADHAQRPLSEHFADYLDFLKVKTVRGRKVSPIHRSNVGRQLTRLAGDCGFKRLRDIARQPIIRWMNEQADTDDISPRTVNTHRAAMLAFCNWCVKNQRITTNPLEGLPKADESDTRRNRRPLSQDEIAALLNAAESRPLREALTIRRGKNKGKPLAQVSDLQRAKLQEQGRERALIYRTMIYTGLRAGELGKVTAGAVHLDAEQPHIALAAKDAKSAKAAMIPLRADLADALRLHLADRLSELQRRTLADGRTVYPDRLPENAKLFHHIPSIRTFDKDLKAAGIPKADAQGRTVDIHALRHTFATMLSRAGVEPRRAQELLRHGDIRLTMNTYTHLSIVDTVGAVESLPEIISASDVVAVRNGTDNTLTKPNIIGDEIGDVLPTNGDKISQALSKSMKNQKICDGREVEENKEVRHDVARCYSAEKKRAMGLEPTTASLEGWRSTN